MSDINQYFQYDEMNGISVNDNKPCQSETSINQSPALVIPDLERYAQSYGYEMLLAREAKKLSCDEFATHILHCNDTITINANQLKRWEQGRSNMPLQAEFELLAKVLIDENNTIDDKKAKKEAFTAAYKTQLSATADSEENYSFADSLTALVEDTIDKGYVNSREQLLIKIQTVARALSLCESETFLIARDKGKFIAAIEAGIVIPSAGFVHLANSIIKNQETSCPPLNIFSKDNETSEIPYSIVTGTLPLKSELSDLSEKRIDSTIITLRELASILDISIESAVSIMKVIRQGAASYKAIPIPQDIVRPFTFNGAQGYGLDRASSWNFICKIKDARALDPEIAIAKNAVPYNDSTKHDIITAQELSEILEIPRTTASKIIADIKAAIKEGVPYKGISIPNDLIVTYLHYGQIGYGLKRSSCLNFIEEVKKVVKRDIIPPLPSGEKTIWIREDFAIAMGVSDEEAKEFLKSLYRKAKITEGLTISYYDTEIPKSALIDCEVEMSRRGVRQPYAQELATAHIRFKNRSFIDKISILDGDKITSNMGVGNTWEDRVQPQTSDTVDDDTFGHADSRNQKIER